jgi:hypothetical protein
MGVCERAKRARENFLNFIIYFKRQNSNIKDRYCTFVEKRSLKGVKQKKRRLKGVVRPKEQAPKKGGSFEPKEEWQPYLQLASWPCSVSFAFIYAIRLLVH